MSSSARDSWTALLRRSTNPRAFSRSAGDARAVRSAMVWEIIVDRGTGAAEKVTAEGLDYRFAFDLADLGLDKQ